MNSPTGKENTLKRVYSRLVPDQRIPYYQPSNSRSTAKHVFDGENILLGRVLFSAGEQGEEKRAALACFANHPHGSAQLLHDAFDDREAQTVSADLSLA
jgi:hypothetical protein